MRGEKTQIFRTLEEREQEFVNDLRKEDEFFHTENNEVEIQLLG